MITPQIRELSNGDFCVDFGRRWFRVFKDRTVRKSWVKRGESHIRQKTATPKETDMAIRAVLMRP